MRYAAVNWVNPNAQTKEFSMNLATIKGQAHMMFAYVNTPSFLEAVNAIGINANNVSDENCNVATPLTRSLAVDAGPFAIMGLNDLGVESACDDLTAELESTLGYRVWFRSLTGMNNYYTNQRPLLFAQAKAIWPTLTNDGTVPQQIRALLAADPDVNATRRELRRGIFRAFDQSVRPHE